MNKFFSSLVISSKNFPNTHQVFRPRYNKEFFKRLTKNIDQLEFHVKSRCPATSTLSRDKLGVIKDESQRYVKLKDQLEKINKDVEPSKYSEVLNELDDIQERIMPYVIDIPNRFSQNTPRTDTIIDQVESDFLKDQNLTKVLNFTKLSYINRCYSKSVIGPNSHYYTGIGAKLQLGLEDYFHDQLEKNKFIPLSGNCLAKSALVEACHSKEEKDFKTDQCRVLSDKPDPTTFHMVEASRESLVGFLTSLGHIVSDEPVRFMTSGASYRSGTKWFDPDTKKATQFQTIHALVWNSSIQQYSVKEYDRVMNLIWDIYKPLDLPIRLIHCSLKSMFPNEYDAHRIEIWLPSQKSWITTARISHFIDYISIRACIKRGHLIDSTIFDGQALGSAIVENRQTWNGKFIIPSVLHKHMPYLTDDERSSYIDNRCQSDNQNNGISIKPQSMTNFEQRRYLVKRTALFGHSKRVEKNSFRRKVRYVMLFGIIHVFVFMDWDEIYNNMTPTWFQRLTYDYMFRPVRRIYRTWVYEGVEPPPDLSYDETDRSKYMKNMYERRIADFETKRSAV